MVDDSSKNWREKPDEECNEFELLHKQWRFEQNGKIFQKLHKENDSVRYCEKCKTNTKHILGIGCLSCHNKKDFMRESSRRTMNNLWSNEEWSARMKNILSEFSKNQSLEDKLYALSKAYEKSKWLFENDPEWKNKRTNANNQNLIKARIAWKYLWDNDKEWKEETLKQIKLNLYKAVDKTKWLWENDSEWAERQLQIINNNLNVFREKQISIVNEKINKLNITLNNSKIDICKIKDLKKNDICGAYVIKAKFKYEKDINNIGNVYKILVCKSVRVYDEINWVLRVISQPEKQDKHNLSWTIAKWWYIANLYYDFEFELLTDINGVSEEEALLCEAKYAVDNNLFINFNTNNLSIFRKPIIENKHCYFSFDIKTQNYIIEN